MIKIKDITSHLERVAPLALQESYDNSGLILGNADWEVTGILICLDSTEAVIDDAIRKKCNLIIAHHPIIFKGIKNLISNNYLERAVIKAIKNDIAIYAFHTNLDNMLKGVNFKIAEKLKLENVKILHNKKDSLEKLVTFIPKEYADQTLDALFSVGAGKIGNYKNCSFKSLGIGSFTPNEDASPFIGVNGESQIVEEIRAEVIFPSYLRNIVLEALMKTHPYEMPAYDVYSLLNDNPEIGAGALGYLRDSLTEDSFLKYLKNTMGLICFRHTKKTDRQIKKIALCGGAGSFLLKKAIMENADAFITSDFKYHEFFDADNKILVVDIGHYESEVFTKELIFDILKEKFSNIAILLTNINTNPIQYFY